MNSKILWFKLYFKNSKHLLSKLNKLKEKESFCLIENNAPDGTGEVI